MERRTIEIKVRLNRKEREMLDKKVKKAGLSREAYIRMLLRGVVPKEKPPADFYSMMRELREISTELHKIAAVGKYQRFDDSQYQEECKKLNRAIVKIMKAVLMPQEEEWQ